MSLHRHNCCVTAPSLLLCDCIIITGVSLNHHYWCVSSSSYCHHHYIIIVRNMYSWADHSAKHELLSSPLCKTCLLASCCKQKSGGFPRNSNKSNHCYCVTASLLLLCHCIIIINVSLHHHYYCVTKSSLLLCHCITINIVSLHHHYCCVAALT